MRLEDAERTLPTDLAECRPIRHTGFVADPVTTKTRETLLNQLSQLPSTHEWRSCANPESDESLSPAGRA